MEQLSQPLEIDIQSAEMTARFEEALIYKKRGFVKARPGKKGELVKTVLQDGFHETDNVVQEDGEMIVTNPDGEEYIPSDFWSRYEPTDTEGVYRAKGMIRAFQNPTGQNVKITASWGPQAGQFDPSCMFAVIFNPAEPATIGQKRYLIGYEEFLNTYGPIEEGITYQEFLASQALNS